MTEKEHAQAAAMTDGMALLQAFNNGFEATKTPPSAYLTDEANANMTWVIRRITPPYCDLDGSRQWTGRTAAIAVEKAFTAMGLSFDAQPRAQAAAPPVSVEHEYAVPSSAPPALYQHDDGRYALALGDVARHKLTDGDPAWHRVPLDLVVGSALTDHIADARKMATESNRRDAERYRWLRERNGTTNTDIEVEIFIDSEAHGLGHLDAQIDAAMASEGGE